MKIEDIRSLVTLIEQSKNESLKKILIDYLAAQLAKENLIEPETLPDSPWAYNKGCRVCGIGADGSPIGYVCSRTDCPTRITSY